jgi:HEAT repeats/PBS lyase HEAT-like repeat
VDAARIEAINTCPQGWWATKRDVVHLAEVIAEPRISLRYRLWAIQGLHLWRDRFDVVAPALIGALADPISWMRRDAARALYRMSTSCDIREAVPALRRLLADPEEHVRLAAAVALSAVGDQTAIAPLIEIADTARFANSRGGAVAALARLHTLEGERRMCRYLTDRGRAGWAAGWLGEMGTPSSIPALKRAQRWHPFSRGDYTAAISEIERRQAEQTFGPPGVGRKRAAPK